jgi:hypothetical protein
LAASRYRDSDATSAIRTGQDAVPQLGRLRHRPGAGPALANFFGVVIPTVEPS